MIEVRNLTRVFRTYKKQPGFWGGVRGLFHRQFEETRAADDVTFDIENVAYPGMITNEWGAWQMFAAADRLRANSYAHVEERYREAERERDETYVAAAKKHYVDSALDSLSRKLVGGDDPLPSTRIHQGLRDRLERLLSDGFLVALRRLAAHAAPNLRHYDLEKDGVRAPDPRQAEEDFRRYGDLLTRTLKRFSSRDSFQGTARCLTPIGFSGANRIVAVVRILTNKETWHERLDVVYGTLPQEFVDDWKKRCGEPDVVYGGRN